MLNFLKNKKPTDNNSFTKPVTTKTVTPNMSRVSPKPLTVAEIVCLNFNFSVHNYQN